MDRVILQVPVTRNLRDAAESTAYDFGFSSLQEAIRIFMAKMASKQITFTFGEASEYLTARQEKILSKKYQKFLLDKKVKKTYIARSAEEMLSQLMS